MKLVNVAKFKDCLEAWRVLKNTQVFIPNISLSLWHLLAAFWQEGFSLSALLVWQARRFPQRVALVVEGQPIRYWELLVRVDVAAGRLSNGLVSGNRVALLCRNNAEFVVYLLAANRLGIHVLLLNHWLSAQQWTDLCVRQQVDLVVCDHEFVEQWRQHGANGLNGSQVVSTLEIQNWKSVPSSNHCQARGIWKAPAQIALLTSGTSGPPKVLERGRHQPLGLAALGDIVRRIGFRSGQRTLLTVPLFHGHGLVTLATCFALASPLYLQRRSRTQDIWRIVQEQQIEVLVLVPTVLYRLLQQPQMVPPSLKTILSGSGMLSANLCKEALSHFGPTLYNLYGTSETGIIALATPSDLAQVPGTVGRPLAGIHLELKGNEGLLWKNAFGQSLKIGDLAKWGSSGLLILQGRCDDLIVRGGENITPEGIEERLLTLNYIQECAVCGVPCPEYGQQVHAFVVLREEFKHLEAEVILAELQKILPRTVQPSRLTLLGGLPRNAVGKLSRITLREMAVKA